MRYCHTEDRSGIDFIGQVEILFMTASSVLVKSIIILSCLLMLTPLIMSANTIFPFIVGKALYSRTIIEIIFCLWIILVFIDNKYRPTISIIFLSILLYFIIVLITSFFGVNFSKSLWSTYERMQGIYDMLHWVGFILVITSVFKDWNDYKKIFIINCIIFSSVPILLFLINFSNNISLSTSLTFGNTSYLSQYCVMSMFIACLLFIKQYETNHKFTIINLFYIISILINLPVLWYAASRASFLAVFVSLFMFSIVYMFAKSTKFIKYISYTCVSLVLISLIFFTVILFMDDLPFSEINYIVHKIKNTSIDNSINQRIVTIKASIDAFYDRPLAGWGLENYISAWGYNIKYYTLEVFDTAHNKLFDVLVASGIIGLVSYVGIWVILFFNVVVLFFRTKQLEQVFITVLGISLLAFLIHIMFLFDTAIGIMHLSLLTALSIYYENKYNIFNNMKQYLRKWIFKEKYYVVFMNSDVLKTIIMILAPSILCLLIFLISYKQLEGAQHMAQGTRHSMLNYKIYHYQKSLLYFESLGTYPAIHMVQDIYDNLHSYVIVNHNGQSVINKKRLDEIVIVARWFAEKAIKHDPYNYTVYFKIAIMYISLYQLDSIYLDDATYYINKSISLAPNYDQNKHLLEYYERIKNKHIK